LIKDFHERYISWEEYEENLKRLEANRQSGEGYNGSAAREGSALLQGLALCGICGKRMRVRYRACGGSLYPQYQCMGLDEAMAGPRCQDIPGQRIDQAVGGLLVETMNPMALEVALAVQQELQDRLEEADKLRYRQVERARQEAELAQRRYMRVDPDNRLVADSLEADWNMRLRELRETQRQYEGQRRKDQQLLTDQMREKIRELTDNFSSLWHDPQVPQRERKRIARLLLEDVTLRREPDRIEIHVRFKAGTVKTLILGRPKTSWERWTTDPAVINRIDRLLDQYTNDKAASILNAEGYSSGKGNPFDGNRIARTCRAYGLKSRYERLRQAGMLTREELAAKQDVHRMTITKWRERGRIKGHLADDQGQYLYEDPGEINLRLKKKQPSNTVRNPGGQSNVSSTTKEV